MSQRISQTRMNPEVKTEWVAALRSGEYSQGDGVLRDTGDSYCCLGVLCDLAVKRGVIDHPITGGVTSNGQSAWVFGDGATQYPPDAVIEWAGLPSEDPLVAFDDEDSEDGVSSIRDRSLAEINDEGQSFDTIAKLIEESL